MKDGLSTLHREAIPLTWVDRIWQRLNFKYGNKFLDMWAAFDIAEVKQAWSEDLAGYTAEELKRGLDALGDWPPTLPEFMRLCRPPIDPKREWAEACEQMAIRLKGQGEDKWSRPEVYWAAASIGMFDLKNNAWEQIKGRWLNAIAMAKPDPVPEYRAALPAPSAVTLTDEEAKERIRKLAEEVGTGKPLDGTTAKGRQWAYKLMEREASGETLDNVSASSWREVLGFAADANAKAALKKSQQAKKDR